MAETADALCLHCEQRPMETGLGLCRVCNAVVGVPILYVARPHLNRPWWWESHLRRLTARAKRQLPLFEEPNHDADAATDAEDPDLGPNA